MKRAMLEVVASGVVKTVDDVQQYISCTLLAATNERRVGCRASRRRPTCPLLAHAHAAAHRPDPRGPTRAAPPRRAAAPCEQVVSETTLAALHWLAGRKKEENRHQFIYWDRDTDTWKPTAFGRAVLASGLPPKECIELKARARWARRACGGWGRRGRGAGSGGSAAPAERSAWGAGFAIGTARAPSPPLPRLQEDLERARESFVLTTELHLTYLCVPITTVLPMDWKRLARILGHLNVGGKAPPRSGSPRQRTADSLRATPDSGARPPAMAGCPA